MTDQLHGDRAWDAGPLEVPYCGAAEDTGQAGRIGGSIPSAAEALDPLSVVEIRSAAGRRLGRARAALPRPWSRTRSDSPWKGGSSRARSTGSATSPERLRARAATPEALLGLPDSFRTLRFWNEVRSYEILRALARSVFHPAPRGGDRARGGARPGRARLQPLPRAARALETPAREPVGAPGLGSRIRARPRIPRAGEQNQWSALSLARLGLLSRCWHDRARVRGLGHTVVNYFLSEAHLVIEYRDW